MPNALRDFYAASLSRDCYEKSICDKQAGKRLLTKVWKWINKKTIKDIFRDSNNHYFNTRIFIFGNFSKLMTENEDVKLGK